MTTATATGTYYDVPLGPPVPPSQVPTYSATVTATDPKTCPVHNNQTGQTQDLLVFNHLQVVASGLGGAPFVFNAPCP